MDHIFKAALSVEKSKEILLHRAYLKGIEISFKPDKLIIQNCKIRIQFIDYHVPFIAEISNVNNITLIKGHITLPRFHKILMLAMYTVFACMVLLSIETGTKIYFPLTFLLIVALCMTGMSKVIQNLYSRNFPLHNKKVKELLNSIVSDFPIDDMSV